MNLSESLSTLRRRWILTLSLLVLAGVATAAVAVELPKTYTSTAQVALFASKTDSKLYYDSNPFLAFDDSLNVAADVLGRRMMDPRIVSMLAAKGDASAYTVEDAPTSPGPVLIITVTGKKSAEVESTLQGVTNSMATQLATMQSAVSQQNRITDTVLSLSLSPTLSLSKMARPLVAFVVVALVLALGIPLIVEGISVGRRAKAKAAARTPDPDSEDDTAAPSASAAPTVQPSYDGVGSKGSK